MPHPVTLGGAIQRELCPERRVRFEVGGVMKRRRASVIAVEELVRIGVLTVHTNYSRGHHGRLYSCWYQLGSGALPCENSDGERVLATRDVVAGQIAALAKAKAAAPV